jgi:6-pyruvoyl-tetrahydropterin synthase related domain
MLDSAGSKGSTAVLVILGAAFAAILPAFFYGIPFSRDLYHHFRLAIAFFDAARQGDFYPGWLAQANGSFGEISPRFYPPALSYLLLTGRLLLGNWYVSALFSFVVLTFLGGLGVYFWARAFMARSNAVWAGILYIFTPYHLNELYQSSLLAEYAAAAILPFAFAFTERIVRGGGKRDMAGLAAAYAGLVLTHTPLTVIGSYALLAYTLASLMSSNRKLLAKTAARLSAAVGLGLLASACFWVTVLAELQWLRPDIQPENVFSWRMFLFSSFARTTIGIWYGNLIAVATVLMALPAVVPPRNRKIWGVVAGSLLMATLISYPLWQVVPLLKSVQVPWRWLCVTSMGAAILAAGSIEKWKELARGGTRPLALLAAGCVAGAIAFSVSHPVREARYLSRAQFDGVLQNLELPSIGAWYPRWVTPQYLYTRQPVVADGRSITIAAWEPERRQFHISAGEGREARVRTFYYPLWNASAHGKALDIRPADDGAMLISIPREETTVDLVFLEPWRSKVVVILSVIGFFAIMVIAFVLD